MPKQQNPVGKILFIFPSSQVFVMCSKKNQTTDQNIRNVVKVERVEDEKKKCWNEKHLRDPRRRRRTEEKKKHKRLMTT